MAQTLGRQKGYTVVEVTLFLGISGLLFLVALFATGSTIRTVRFSDSGFSLEAFIQKQYDNVLNGVNTRGDQIVCNAGSIVSGSQTPGTSDCFFMGKLVLFDQGNYQVNTYDIIGVEPDDLDLGQSDEQLIADYQPSVVTSSGTETYSIPWQAYISGIRRVSTADATPQATNALALIRSPRSSRIVSYTYEEPATSPTVNLLSIVSVPTTNANKLTNYCLSSADNIGIPAKLVISGTGSNQAAAQIVFDSVVVEDCDGA